MKARSNTAFTLMELLVTIAIIAILAALFLTAPARAKAKARSIQCLSDLKQWGLAMTMYAADNEEDLPRENGANGINRWPVIAAETNRDVWYNALSDHLAKPPAHAYEPSLESRREFHTAFSLFTCSAARFDPADLATYPNFSRGMNSRLRIGTSSSKVSAFMEPTRTPFFLDAGVTGEAPLGSQPVNAYDGRPHVKWDRASIRHGGFGNVVFADGHAAPVPSRCLTNAAPSDLIHWEAW